MTVSFRPRLTQKFDEKVYPMYSLTVTSQFSAAHFLVDYPGACRRVHGHNWKVKACFVAAELDPQGMVIDLMQLKEALDHVLSDFDHRVLNEVPPFDRINPTSENLARIIHHTLSAAVKGVQLHALEVFETDDFSVMYTPEADARPSDLP